MLARACWFEAIDSSLAMELQTLPFDVDTIFAKMKKKQIRKLRGPNSPLYKATWPMICVVRVFGFAPYTFSQNRLVPSNINLIFTAIATIFYSYILYIVFKRFLSVQREIWTLGGTENTKVRKELVKIKITDCIHTYI